MSRVIAAISTPDGAGGLGVVRLSGEGALEAAERVFRPAGAKRLRDMAGYTAAYGHVYDRGGDIDECVALVFRKPHSYTGEDTVELSCHGGRYTLKRVLRAVLAAGAGPAAAGEFTRRAFLNGKIDLTRAEAVMDIIGAQGQRAAVMAASAREGALFKAVAGIRDELLVAAANLTAFVDYPDEDIPELSPEALRAVLEKAVGELGRLLDTYDAGRVLREGVDTVIVGSPNVGKSTLMNMLAGCERSIVTAVPGTTRDIVEETVRVGDVLLRLSDTAGIRATGDEVEAIGVRRAEKRMAEAELVIAVFDGARPLSGEDKALADKAARYPAIAVINKTDQDQLIDEAYIKDKYKHIVYTAARNNDGAEALEAAIAAMTGIDRLEEGRPMLATERQRDSVIRCCEAATEALSALDGGMTLDAVQVGVDDAIAALLELTGERVTDAVVDEVFARFCVGK